MSYPLHMILVYNPLVSGIHMGEFDCLCRNLLHYFQGLGVLQGVLVGFRGSLSKTVAVWVCACACVFAFVCFFLICVFCVFGCSHSMRRKVAGTLCVCALNELTRTSMRALPQTSGPSFIQQSRKLSQFWQGGGRRSYLSSL